MPPTVTKSLPQFKTERPGVSALRQLLQAKAESDRRNYTVKHDIMRRLMTDNPDDFIVDDPSGKHHGYTHTPTGFKMHGPAGLIPGEALIPDAELATLAQPRRTVADSFDDTAKQAEALLNQLRKFV